MKKSVLALAVMGTFAGAASAQSSVTLYGRIEANVTQTRGASPGYSGTSPSEESNTRLDDGGANSGIGGSRFGFRGVEDLGGGLKANFVLESQFDSGTGGQESSVNGVLVNRFFNRLAWVGLSSSSFGDIRFGRQETVSRQINSGFSDVSAVGELKIDESVQRTTAVNANGSSPLGIGTAAQLFQTFGQRVDNAFSYISPSFGGFKGQLIAAAGENTFADYYGVQFSYVSGPVAVALGYEEMASFFNPAATAFSNNGAWNKTLNLGGNYNFGPATLFLGYQDVKDVGSTFGTSVGPITNLTTLPGSRSGTIKDQKAYTVGVLVPVGSWQFRANYIRADYDLDVGNADIEKYGVSARYILSKRTLVYGAYTERKGSTDQATASVVQRFDDSYFAQKREFSLGIAHTF